MLKKVKCIFAMALFLFALPVACDSKQVKEEKSHMTEKKSSSAIKSDVENTVITIKGEEGKSSDISISPKKVTIYTLDGEKDMVVPLTTVITSKEEIEPKDIISSVFLELDDLIDREIPVNITSENESITVDFKVDDTKYPFGQTNPPESLILDCISYSIFENFSDYTKIYFKVNGEAYNSKQLKLTDKKPFMIDE